jgi:hypothetical protein
LLWSIRARQFGELKSFIPVCQVIRIVNLNVGVERDRFRGNDVSETVYKVPAGGTDVGPEMRHSLLESGRF